MLYNVHGQVTPRRRNNGDISALLPICGCDDPNVNKLLELLLRLGIRNSWKLLCLSLDTLIGTCLWVSLSMKVENSGSLWIRFRTSILSLRMESILKDLLRWSTWEHKLRRLGFSPIPPPVSIISESDIVCAWVITTYDKTLENTDMSITRAPVS